MQLVHLNLIKIYLVLCFSVISCATKDDGPVIPPPIKEDEHVDLVQNFDLSKDQANSFKAYEVSPQPTPKVEEVIVPPKAVEKPTKNIKKTLKKESKDRKDVVEVIKVKEAEAKVSQLPILPENYPEEFLKYDEKSKAVWKKINPAFYRGEETTMAVTYLGVTAGHITITSKEVVSLNNKTAFHYVARFKSNDSYRYFYWLDDRLDSYVEKNTFLPIKYMLIQREKKQSVDDLQLFDFSKMTTYFWYKRIKKDANKDEKGESIIPQYAQDSFSALQFVRGMPLLKGDVYEFPVITRGKIWSLKIEVMGEEKIEIGGEDVLAIKIKAETHFPGVLKKMGDTFFWYGATPERRLLKFQAKIKIGSIYGETVTHKSGERL